MIYDVVSVATLVVALSLVALVGGLAGLGVCALFDLVWSAALGRFVSRAEAKRVRDPQRDAFDEWWDSDADDDSVPL